VKTLHKNGIINIIIKYITVKVKYEVILLNYIQGQDRNQLVLFPDLIDSCISEDNPVRAIDAFVDGLNMSELGFKRAIPARNGRPGYDPRDLLKLYLYGYMNRIRSSRKLETETNRNIELMWLLKGLTPDFKTIADFRKDNKKAIKNVFKEFTLLCKSWDLLSKELIAVDGSKFKAWNGKKKNFNTRKLKRKLQEINKKIDEYLKLLDESDDDNDNNKPGNINPNKIKNKVKKLNEKKEQYEKYQKIIKENETTQISLTDPEARSMVNNQKIEVCYNVQSVVEEKNKLIIDYKVTNRTKDHDLLSVMSKRAQEILNVENLEVLADKGYHKGVDIKKCIDNNINPYVPKPESKSKYYSPDDFEYDAEKDCFICPDGAILTLSNHFKRNGKNYKRYNNEEACQDCRLKVLLCL